MKRACLVYDSTSNINTKLYKDVFLLPQQIIETSSVDEKTYKDLVDIFPDAMAKKMIDGSTFKTAASNPADAIQLFDQLSKQYEEIFVFLIPNTLSYGQNNVVSLVAEDFPNVHIIPHYMISFMSQWELDELLQLNKTGKLTVKTATAVVNKYRDKLGALLIVPDLSYLVKGGRISKTRGFIGKLLKVTALCSFDKLGINFFAKALTTSKIATQIDKYFNDTFKNFDYSKISRIGIMRSTITSKDFDMSKYQSLIENTIFPKIDKKILKDITIQEAPGVVLAHMGPNYIAVSILLK
ncbi:MAG: fatty acid kinase binding subunit FakB2 [Mycoplasmoidaceae bacterium]|nr:MAG: fatty acid kinase binding subunit FakB2 [Mycoplasmoidaceae bacterium]